MLKTMRFLSLLFVAVSLGAALAHLFALPNKIHLPGGEYLVVQQIYRGWALLGTVVIAALLSTLVLTIMARKRRRAFSLTLISFLCVAGSLVLFFTFTYPANRQTSNWTLLPPDWEGLRTQWEYSHAAAAVLYLIAFSTLVLSVLVPERSATERWHAVHAARREPEMARGRRTGDHV
jgi:hypothetical protein